MAGSAPSVEIEKLSFSWDREAPAISVEHLVLKAGESVFIKGPSGSGKSTLLNLLGGVLRPDTGDIKLLGRNLNGLSASQVDHFRADHMGYIFQQFNLLPYLSVIENVVLPCRFSNLRRNRAVQQFGSIAEGAAALLKKLGFTEKLIQTSSVLALSTGQQQRVAAARALLGSPEIIIADEPTSALDTEHRDLFIDLLVEQCKELSSTLIFVSHDPYLQSHFQRVEQLEASAQGGFSL